MVVPLFTWFFPWVVRLMRVDIQTHWDLDYKEYFAFSLGNLSQSPLYIKEPHIQQQR